MSIDCDDLDDLRSLTDARTIDASAVVDQLRLMTSKTHASDHRKPMTEGEKLLDEAFWYASRGEMDEALYRLRMVDDDGEDDGESDE